MGFCKRLIFALGGDEQCLRSHCVRETEMDFTYLTAAIDCRTLALMRNGFIFCQNTRAKSLNTRLLHYTTPASISTYLRYCEKLKLFNTGLDNQDCIVEEHVVYQNLVHSICRILSTDLAEPLFQNKDLLVTLVCQNIQEDILDAETLNIVRKAIHGITFPGTIYWPKYTRFRRNNPKWGKFIYSSDKQLLTVMSLATDSPSDYAELLSDSADPMDVKPPDNGRIDIPKDTSVSRASLTVSTVDVNKIFDSFSNGCVLVDGDNVPPPMLYVILRLLHQKKSVKQVLIICDTPPIFRWDLGFPSLVHFEVADHTRAKKNAGDILLAYRLAHLEISEKFDKFILVSSDSDYASLCKLLSHKLLLLVDESRASTAYFHLLSESGVDYILMRDLMPTALVAQLLGKGTTPDLNFITHLLMNGGSLLK